MLDSIAWLFNIRGGDISHTPVALAFAIVPRDGKALLFIDTAKISDNVRGHLADAAEILAPDALQGKLVALGKEGARVRIDPETTSVRFKHILEAAGAKIVTGEDPCILPKAIKNEAEIKGARAAHLRDGAAMTRFLAWLDENAASGASMRSRPRSNSKASGARPASSRISPSTASPRRARMARSCITGQRPRTT